MANLVDKAHSLIGFSDLNGTLSEIKHHAAKAVVFPLAFVVTTAIVGIFAAIVASVAESLTFFLDTAVAAHPSLNIVHGSTLLHGASIENHSGSEARIASHIGVLRVVARAGHIVGFEVIFIEIRLLEIDNGLSGSEHIVGIDEFLQGYGAREVVALNRSARHPPEGVSTEIGLPDSLLVDGVAAPIVGCSKIFAVGAVVVVGLHLGVKLIAVVDDSVLGNTLPLVTS